MEERLHGGNQISDKFVVVDFERAIHNALLEIFPDATLYGQGCISCGILVSGIGARGVSSEHMENMEMFSCSPT